MNKKTIALLCFVLGIVFIVFAIIYFITPAKSLPAFLPGYTAGLAKAHYKHGIGSLLIGLLFFAVGWFQSGKKQAKISATKEREEKSA